MAAPFRPVPNYRAIAESHRLEYRVVESSLFIDGSVVVSRPVDFISIVQELLALPNGLILVTVVLPCAMPIEQEIEMVKDLSMAGASTILLKEGESFDFVVSERRKYSFDVAGLRDPNSRPKLRASEAELLALAGYGYTPDERKRLQDAYRDNSESTSILN